MKNLIKSLGILLRLAPVTVPDRSYPRPTTVDELVAELLVAGGPEFDDARSSDRTETPKSLFRIIRNARRLLNGVTDLREDLESGRKILLVESPEQARLLRHYLLSPTG